MSNHKLLILTGPIILLFLISTSCYQTPPLESSTASLPRAPRIYEPPSGATGVSISPSFTWENIEEADLYIFELSDSNDFTNILEIAQLIESNYRLSTTLEYGHKYFFRVKAVNVIGESYWAIHSFTTFGVPTSTPPPPAIPPPLPPPAETEESGLYSYDVVDIDDFVEPTNAVVRNTALSSIRDAPAGIAIDSEPWKMWKVNFWVAENIGYVSDPKGSEYFATATETLETKAGDCDDFAILLASMYESVGMDAAIAKIDTDEDDTSDHMCCFVYWSGDVDDLIDEIKDIMGEEMLSSPTGEIHIRYLEAGKSKLLPKYDEGSWILADPPMAEVRNMVGYVTVEPYDVLSIVDVGN